MMLLWATVDVIAAVAATVAATVAAVAAVVETNKKLPYNNLTNIVHTESTLYRS